MINYPIITIDSFSECIRKKNTRKHLDEVLKIRNSTDSYLALDYNDKVLVKQRSRVRKFVEQLNN